MFTHDDCGNVIKTQAFYNKNNKEHLLSIAAYDSGFNPFYLIGLHRLEPFFYSVHNPVMEQIVYWDCADYDASPQKTTYEYDTDQLPVRKTGPNYTTLFFYE